MICNNVLQAVGGTPLVRLQRMTGPEDAQVLVKFEGVNVGGSVKTRTALKMIEEAEAAASWDPIPSSSSRQAATRAWAWLSWRR